MGATMADAMDVEPAAAAAAAAAAAVAAAAAAAAPAAALAAPAAAQHGATNAAGPPAPAVAAQDDDEPDVVELAFVDPDAAPLDAADVTRSKFGGVPVRLPRGRHWLDLAFQPLTRECTGLGGLARQVWLDRRRLPAAALLACGRCGDPRSLICQVRRPRPEADAVEHGQPC